MESMWGYFILPQMPWWLCHLVKTSNTVSTATLPIVTPNSKSHEMWVTTVSPSTSTVAGLVV